MKSLPLTPYQKHVRDWKDCTRCDLHKNRYRTVLYKGKLPCDVLFIGEAPGVSENTTGKPFTGRAGHLLDQIIHNATNHMNEPPRMGFMNLLACIPFDDEGQKKVKEPPPESIEACAPRVQELVDMACPKVVIFVGAVAEAWLDPKYATNVTMPKALYERIDHPAYILRQNIAQQGLLAQMAEVRVRNLIEDMLMKKNPR